VILIGLHYPERLLFVLALLVFFSIGLGAVLTGIGVSLVAGKALLASRAREGEFFQQISFLRAMLPSSFLAWLDRVGLRLFKLLPALSALFIAALGAFFCASTYATGKTELAAMLRQLAEWIQ
jgi:F0F1-type ATP synthase membrane subunit c/vacuolar-type H+-ATPase subunit K